MKLKYIQKSINYRLFILFLMAHMGHLFQVSLAINIMKFYFLLNIYDMMLFNNDLVLI